MSKKTIYALALGSALLLSGCFGGGGDDALVEAPVPPVAATMVPASALASSTAYTQFAVSQSLTASESDEPLSASNVDVPPSSETDEPVSVS